MGGILPHSTEVRICPGLTCPWIWRFQGDFPSRAIFPPHRNRVSLCPPPAKGVRYMDRKVVEVPGISEGVRKVGAPLSPVIKANGFVFVSGLPPMDLKTGAIVKGDIATQTDASLKAVKHA